MQEIDQALNNLYDNLNEEYKEEISKNPELILYYIFTDIGASESYTTPFNIRNCNLEDDYNKINNITKKNTSLYYNNSEENRVIGKTTSFRNSIAEDNREDNNISNKFIKKKRTSNQYQVEGIPEERKLVFSDNSSSSEDNKNKDKAFDFDTTMVAINETRKQFKDVSEEADLAAQEANESEELLQKVSNEYTEVEKQLKAKEKHSKEMEKKIISILTSEKDRLSQQLHEKETMISRANKIKEQNNDKIVDFRSKINSTIEKSNEIDERISKQEELLNTLVGFNMDLEDYQNGKTERKVGKAS